MFDTSIEVKEGNLATQASNMLQVFLLYWWVCSARAQVKEGNLQLKHRTYSSLYSDALL